MPVIDPPVECAEPGNTAKREWYLEQVKTNSDADNFDYSERFFDTTEDLWKDKGVLECFARSNEYQVCPFAKVRFIYMYCPYLSMINGSMIMINFLAADRLSQILLGEGGDGAAGELLSLGTGHPQGKSTHLRDI